MRYPGATWSGSPNETVGGMIEHLGLVLHVEQGTQEGTDSWFHNPASQVSAHFGVSRTGVVTQWVDTDDKAWAEAAGNPYWLSIEIEGYSGDEATLGQLDAIARLYAWGVTTFGWPMATTDDPQHGGLGWHGMGGAAWGSHVFCPGAPIVAQRAEILHRASAYLPQPQPQLQGGIMHIGADILNGNIANPGGFGYIDVAVPVGSFVCGWVLNGSDAMDPFPTTSFRVTAARQIGGGKWRINFTGAIPPAPGSDPNGVALGLHLAVSD